ncbi:MAG: mannitol dehydrogenase family protein [Rhizobacter sp.]|nr:mannitol dehydrogenase family protein [Rhizobacter sp.]
MDRLQPDRLARLPPDVARPHHDRVALRTGIVHLGIGAFARAHLVAATEAALNAGDAPHWGIAGISLRQPDTHAALVPQQGLYTLALRDAADDGSPRETLQVVGALVQLLVAPPQPAAVLDLIAHPETRIVSLTVTEKGYHHDPASGALRSQDADIVHDLQHADAPRSTIGYVVRGLQRRLQRALPPVTLLSCDNLPANGDTLRGLALAFAQQVDPALQAWIESRCSFPNSMVDRIVPRTTAEDRERIAARLGLDDAWPVVAEPYSEWVVEDRFVAGRPAWEHAGVRFVERAEPYERLKLRMVNGSHSALAYLGVMAGWATVDEAIAQPALRRFIDTMMRDEIAPTLPPMAGLDLDAYRARLLQRFANPALQHRTLQIAMDGSQKLPQRLLGTVRERLAAGLRIDALALAVAAWLHHLGGVDEQGRVFEIQDPLAPALQQQLGLAEEGARGTAEPLQREVQRCATLCRFTPVFGDLGDSADLVGAIARHTLSLREQGVLATLEALQSGT